MNIAMAQRELFNGIISSKGFSRPGVVEGDGTRVFSSDGYTAYCIRESDFALDVAKFRKVDATIPLLKTDQDSLLIWTKAAIIDESNRIARRYEGQDFSIYINPARLRCFDNPELYAYSPKERVSVYEKGQFVGVVLPLRMGSERDIGLLEKVLEDLKSA